MTPYSWRPYKVWYGEDAHRLEIQGITRQLSNTTLDVALADQGITLASTHWLMPWHHQYRYPSKAQRAVLLQGIGSMLGSGIGIEDCVRLSQRSGAKQAFLWQLYNLRELLIEGVNFAEALRQTKLVTDCQGALLAAGEETGNLPLVLNRIYEQEKQQLLLAKALKKSMFMPTVTVVAAIGVSVMVLLWLVPSIGGLVDISGKEVPVATQVLLTMSEVMRTNAKQIVTASVILVFVSIVVSKIPLGQTVFSQCVRWLPVIGKLQRQQASLNLVQTIALALNSGLSITRALAIAHDVIALPALRKQVRAINTNIQSGVSVSKAFAQTNFDQALVVTLEIGENTGDLKMAFDRYAELLTDNINTSIDTLKQLIEPLSTLLLALLVGSLITAIYLPLMQMGSLI